MGQEQQPQSPVADFDLEQYLDRSFDHVARVRAAKESTQREMESFGDVSEYDITIIQGLKKDEPEGAPKTSLDFKDDDTTEPQETK